MYWANPAALDRTVVVQGTAHLATFTTLKMTQVRIQSPAIGEHTFIQRQQAQKIIA